MQTLNVDKDYQYKVIGKTLTLLKHEHCTKVFEFNLMLIE